MLTSAFKGPARLSQGFRWSLKVSEPYFDAFWYRNGLKREEEE